MIVNSEEGRAALQALMAPPDSPVLNGACGDEFYVADELWRMSKDRSPESRDHFWRTVVLMCRVSQPKPRAFHKIKERKADDAP